MSLRLRVVEAPADLAQALAIRHEVFVREQSVPVAEERDAADDTAIHILAVLGGVPVGTGRLVVEPPDYLAAWNVPEAGPLGHLGRIAVLPAQRGTGVGAALVVALEGLARTEGLSITVLSAQVSALAFYERLGYAVVSDVFDDAGIPHRWMLRDVSAWPEEAPGAGT
jgi:predicted GNAT family N-acyltransferase